MTDPAGLPVAPAWIESMRPGCWYRLSGDTPDLGLLPTPTGTRYLQDNDPAQDPGLNPPMSLREHMRRLLGRQPLAPWSGRCGFSAITEAWNSAAFASRYGKSGGMIVFGGGHADYFGSDLHVFDLQARQWSRLCDGYVHGGLNAYGDGAVYPGGTYPDGTPLPPHTYDYLQYDAVGNDLLLLKSQIELGEEVKAIAQPQMFNLSTLSWRQGPVQPGAILNSGGWTTWDAGRRLLWGHSGDYGGGNSFLSFCPDGDNPAQNGRQNTSGRWGKRYPNMFPDAANHNWMQIVPQEDLLVVGNHQRDRLYGIDPNTPSDPPIALREAGDRPRLSPYAALEYSEQLGCLVYYSAQNGAATYTIRPSASMDSQGVDATIWQWSRIDSPDNQLDPVDDAFSFSRHTVARAHTFGRFRIANFAGVDIAVLVRHVDSPVYALAF